VPKSLLPKPPHPREASEPGASCWVMAGLGYADGTVCGSVGRASGSGCLSGRRGDQVLVRAFTTATGTITGKAITSSKTTVTITYSA